MRLENVLKTDKAHTIIYGLLASVSLLIHWYSYGSGLLLTADSYHYLAASKSFIGSGKFIDADGHGFLFWPPLFPILLSILAEKVLPWVHILVNFAILLSLLRLIKTTVLSRGLQLLSFAFVALSVHLLLISTFLWSELFSVLFEVLFVYHLFLSKHQTRNLYYAMLFGFLLCLQRNAGIFIVFGGCIWLLLEQSKLQFSKALKFGLITISGSFIWNIYVWIFKEHEQFDFSVNLFQHALANANALIHAVAYSFIPVNATYAVVPFLAIVILLVKNKKLIGARGSDLLLYSLLIATYLVCVLIVLVVNIAGFPVEFGEADRFISVIMPLLTLLIFRLLDEVTRLFGTPRLKLALFVFMAFWLVYPAARMINNSLQWHRKERTHQSMNINSSPQPPCQIKQNHILPDQSDQTALANQ